ncbi:MAG: indole-3-glycerol phosphate synthase TrpC [Chloroflexi bacterium]|nr:indole-3-glycerol phosphate synthase TrpC [Chloroflexota bacterium]
MILDEILAHKRREVAERMAREPLGPVVERAEAASPPRDFHGALGGAAISIIAEVKRHSPAKGALRLDMDAATQAATYADGGASCVSVLTDARYFHGSDADLVAVRARVGVPVLRKDFVVDPYQVYEARAIGADCVLLIVRALERDELASLAGLAASLGMAALVEVHTEDELRVGLDVGATLVGINNRDLTRMVVDLETTAKLRPLVPDGVTVVSESGIRTPADVRRLREIGVDAALIGESLVVSDDPKALLRDVIAAGRPVPAPTRP